MEIMFPLAVVVLALVLLVVAARRDLTARHCGDCGGPASGRTHLLRLDGARVPICRPCATARITAGLSVEVADR